MRCINKQFLLFIFFVEINEINQYQTLFKIMGINNCFENLYRLKSSCIDCRRNSIYTNLRLRTKKFIKLNSLLKLVLIS